MSREGLAWIHDTNSELGKIRRMAEFILNNEPNLTERSKEYLKLIDITCLSTFKLNDDYYKLTNNL